MSVSNGGKVPVRFHIYWWVSQRLYTTRIENWLYRYSDDYAKWYGERA